MKNNKMMRAASGLMIAALLTTGMISGTFAKYITQDELNDSARVAKWGVNLGISGNLYGEAYGTSNAIVKRDDGATVQSVSTASASDKVVAPGTKNADSGLHITLNGKPEVSTKIYGTVKTQNIYLATGEYGVMVEANHVTAEDFAAGKDNAAGKDKKYYTEANGTYAEANSYVEGTTYYTLEDEVTLAAPYYPVIYTGAGVTNGTTTTDSLNAIGANIAKVLSNNTDVTPTSENGVNVYTVTTGTTYAPNTDLATALPNIAATNITWEWAFGGNDGADTILGDLIAGTGSKVVYKDTSDYKAITVDNNTGLATAGTAAKTTVASTKTSFNITLTVEQAD